MLYGARHGFEVGFADPDLSQCPSATASGVAGETIVISDAYLLFNAEFKKVGNDLLLTGEDGRKFVVHEYFAGERRPTLSTKDGATLTPGLIEALAGPDNPGQYAQAGAVAAATAPIGRVEKASGITTVIRNGVSITLNVGDPVLKGDVVQTGRDSALGISFIDGTAFSLSASARMVLNEMVYDPNSTTNSAMLSLVEGTISFVAGKVAKTGDMRVETPVATMGIRGTAVLVVIESNSGTVTAKHSVLVEPDGHTGSFNVYDKSSGVLMGTVSQAGQWFSVTSTGVQGFTNKTVEDVRVEQVVVAQAFSVAQIAQQIVAEVQKANTDQKATATATTAGGSTSNANVADAGSVKPTGDAAATQAPAPTATPPVPVPTPPTTTQTTTPVTAPADPVIQIVENRAPSVLSLALTVTESGLVDAQRVLASGNLLSGSSDPDGDAVRVSGATVLLGQYGVLAVSSDGTYNYAGTAALDGLKAGQHAVETFTVTATDGKGHDVPLTVTVNLTGANDAPVAAANSNSVLSGQVVSVSTRSQGVLGNDVDRDAGDTATLVVTSVQGSGVSTPVLLGGVTVAGTYGHLTINADGTYSYNADIGSVQTGAHASDVFTYSISDVDGLTSTATLTFDVSSGNSAPVWSGGVISGIASANLVANGGFETGSFAGWTITGNNGFTSVDSNSHSGSYGASFGQISTVGVLSQSVQTVAGQHYSLGFWLANDSGGPVSFEVNWNGSLVYGQSSVQGFPQSFTYYSFDVVGAAGNSTLAFSFRQDPAFWHFDDVVVSGAVGGGATNTPLTADGSVAFTDANLNDLHTASFVAAGPGYLGTFSLDSNVTESSGSGSVGWHFTIDPTIAATLTSNVVQHYNVTITDGSGSSFTQQVAVTIASPQAASFYGTFAGQVTEDSNTSAGGTVSVYDPDVNQIGFQSTFTETGTYGNFSFDNTTGVWSYALDNARADSLGDLQQATDILTVRSLDGSTQDITVTISGTNDAPVITESNPVVLTVTSGDATGTLHATDAEGDALVWTVVDPSNVQPTVAPHAPSYSFRINEFNVTGSNAVSFTDTFSDGVAPAAGPAGFGFNYGLTGAMTETGGFGILDDAHGVTGPGIGGSTNYRGTYVSLLTNMSGSGTLSRSSSFQVTGDFDLTQPDDLLENYGIRLSDNYGQVGNDRLALLVRKGATGEYRVQFRDSDVAAGTTTNLQNITLNPINGENEIRLHLSHVANSYDITASFDLLVRDNAGVETLSRSFSFNVPGQIFTGEDWTRAQFIAETPDPSESYITGLYGTLSVNAAGAYDYSVDSRGTALGVGQSAVEHFQIQASDGQFAATRDITVNVVGANDAPTARDDAATAAAGNGLVNGNVLTNDTDPDTSDHPTVTFVRTGFESQTSGTTTGTVGSVLHGAYGDLTLNADGSFTYLVFSSPCPPAPTTSSPTAPPIPTAAAISPR